MLRVFVNGAQVASDPLTGSIATSTFTAPHRRQCDLGRVVRR